VNEQHHRIDMSNNMVPLAIMQRGLWWDGEILIMVILRSTHN
jgi:hypothetical protein